MAIAPLGLCAMDEGSTKILAETSAAYAAPVQANETVGEVRATIAQIELSALREELKRNYGATLTYTHTSYNFDRNCTFASLREAKLETFGNLNLSGPWGLQAVGALTSGVEKGLGFDDGLYAQGSLSATYQMSDTMQVGLGVLLLDRFEQDNLVLPYPTINWQVTERLNITTANGVFVEYDLTGEQRTSLGLHLEYAFHQYQLDRSSTALIDTGWELGAELKHQVTENLTLGLRADYLLEHDLETRTQGQRIDFIDLDKQVRLSAFGQMAF